MFLEQISVKAEEDRQATIDTKETEDLKVDTEEEAEEDLLTEEDRGMVKDPLGDTETTDIHHQPMTKGNMMQEKCQMIIRMKMHHPLIER